MNITVQIPMQSAFFTSLLITCSTVIKFLEKLEVANCDLKWMHSQGNHTIKRLKEQ